MATSSRKKAAPKASKSKKGKGREEVQEDEDESEDADDVRAREVRRLRKKGSRYFELADELERGGA